MAYRDIPVVKVSRAMHKDGEGERWSLCQVHPTVNIFDLGEVRGCALVARVYYDDSRGKVCV